MLLAVLTLRLHLIKEKNRRMKINKNLLKERDCMKKKIILLVVMVVLLVSWTNIVYSDYADVAISYDKPKFCISTMTADDGGSGKYIGLGYSFDIDGHLDADNGYQVKDRIFQSDYLRR